MTTTSTASTGPVNDVIQLDPFRGKWEAFGWSVIEVDGHNLAQLVDAFDLIDNLYDDGRAKMPPCSHR